MSLGDQQKFSIWRILLTNYTQSVTLKTSGGQNEYVIKEVHEGIYGVHSGSRAMETQVLRAEYYWPTLRTNYAEFEKKTHSVPETR